MLLYRVFRTIRVDGRIAARIRQVRPSSPSGGFDHLGTSIFVGDNVCCDSFRLTVAVSLGHSLRTRS